MKDIISITNLSKTFDKGKKVIFKDLSISFKAKEIIGLIGENGSGKTTLIKMICGLVLPDDGDIRIDGVSVIKEFKKAKSYISVMSDSNTSLHMNLSGYENLDYFATLKGVINSKERKERINNIVDKLKMKEYIHANVDTYSKGMRQRVLFAIAIINEPQVLILDEPINGLDADNAVIMMECLKNLIEEKEITILLTSHDKYFLDEICTQKYVIKNNNILSEDGNFKISKELTFYVKVKEPTEKEIKDYNLEMVDSEEDIYKCKLKLNEDRIYNYIGQSIAENKLEVVKIIS